MLKIIVLLAVLFVPDQEPQFRFSPVPNMENCRMLSGMMAAQVKEAFPAGAKLRTFCIEIDPDERSVMRELRDGEPDTR